MAAFNLAHPLFCSLQARQNLGPGTFFRNSAQFCEQFSLEPFGGSTGLQTETGDRLTPKWGDLSPKGGADRYR